MTHTTGEVLGKVLDERIRQEEKWGEQNHPDGTYSHPAIASAAKAAQRVCEQAAREGSLTWMQILEEEVAEVAAETDPEKLIQELVQVAAVAVAWIEAVQRR